MPHSTPPHRTPHRQRHRWCAALSAGLLLTPLARADDARGEQALELAVTLVNVLVEQGLLSRDKARDLMQQAQDRVAARAQAGAATPPPLAPTAPTTTSAAGPTAAPSTHVQYVPEIVKQALRDDVRADVLAQAQREGWATPGAVPDWTQRLKLDGDLRLRWQHEQFGAGNSTTVKNAQAINQAGTEAISSPFLYTDGAGNVSPNRDRLLVRARVGLTAQVSDNIEAGVRLSTGNTTDPVTTNQTTGNYNDRYQVVIDRAYAHGHVGEHLDLWGGRIDNPFLKTELVWAPELGFDGVAARYRTTWGAQQPFATLGVFPLQEVATSSHDKWLMAAQAGSTWRQNDTQLRWGLAWYGYQNVSGRLNETDLHTTDTTAPGYVQKGNTLYNIRVSSTDPSAALYALAGDYRLVDLTASFDTPVPGGKHLLLQGDWVRNVGWSSDAVRARSGIDASTQTIGYLVKLGWGDAEVSRLGDWQLFGSYRRLGADAVLDAFTETEFHLGGTNTKGFVLGGSYALDDRSVLTLRWQSSDEISGPPLAIDLLQLELNFKF